MRLATKSDRSSSLDRALGFTLAAFSMFVVGYTATRAFLSQPQNVPAADQDFVTPHEAAMWSEFGN